MAKRIFLTAALLLGLAGPGMAEEHEVRIDRDRLSVTVETEDGPGRSAASRTRTTRSPENSPGRRARARPSASSR